MPSTDGAVLLKFWAPWCVPCKSMAPTLENVLSKFGTVEVMSVNVDEDPDAAVEHRVRSVPTLVLMRDGEAAGRLCGARSAEEIEAFLLRHL